MGAAHVTLSRDGRHGSTRAVAGRELDRGRSDCRCRSARVPRVVAVAFPAMVGRAAGVLGRRFRQRRDRPDDGRSIASGRAARRPLTDCTAARGRRLARDGSAGDRRLFHNR